MALTMMMMMKWASRASSYVKISTVHRCFSSVAKDSRYEWIKGIKGYDDSDSTAKDSRYEWIKGIKGYDDDDSDSTAKDSRYEWIKGIKGYDSDSATVGTTDHAQEHLGDAVDRKLHVVGESLKHLGDPVDRKLHVVGESLKRREAFGAVESAKATSDVNSPVSGEVAAVEIRLSDSPGLVTARAYNRGWIIKVSISKTGGLNLLLDSEKYAEAEDSAH